MFLLASLRSSWSSLWNSSRSLSITVRRVSQPLRRHIGIGLQRDGMTRSRHFMLCSVSVLTA